MRIYKSFLVALCLTSCGPNLFQSASERDPAEDATIALENGDADKAIRILEDALESDSSNIQFISILSLAYAQRAGVDPISLIQSLASNASSGGSSQAQDTTSLVSLFSVMPPATQPAINDVDKAVSLLLSIPNAERAQYDNIKLAMFQTSSMTLKLKILDTNGDGQISTAELLSLSGANAAAILNQLATAIASYLPTGQDGEQEQLSKQELEKVQAAILSSPGATSEEKLKNYLATVQTP